MLSKLHYFKKRDRDGRPTLFELFLSLTHSEAGVIERKTIAEIIDENHVYASVLYYFGVDFYDYSESTLEELCESKGLSLKSITEAFERIDEDEEAVMQLLMQLPVDLIIEYLKHSHYVFVKKKLPFLAKQIQGLRVSDGPGDMVNDLQWIFPVFTEDFIHHIYQEEDQLFGYILQLQRVANKEVSASKIYFQLEEGSLQRFSVEHAAHDEEMKGFDKILQGELPTPASWRMKAVISELNAFKQLLINHGKAENEILFPKALVLEGNVKRMIKDLSSLN